MRTHRTLLLGLAFLLICVASLAQDLATILRPKFVGQTVQLRTPLPESKLKFDSKGDLKGLPMHGLRSIDMFLSVKSVKTRHSALLLKGKRLGVVWNSEQQKIEFSRTNIPVEIAIDLPDGSATSEAEFLSVYFKIFHRPEDAAEELKTFAELAKGRLENHLDIPSDSAARTLSLPGGNRVPALKDIKPPKGLETPDPQYPPAVRAKDVEGTNIFRVAIDKKGLVDDAILIHGAEPSFNLISLQTLRNWRFQPATLDGRPFASTVTIEFNFHLY